MDTIWAGYAFAVISSIFSAVYVVPKKLSKQRPSTYAMIMGIGYFAASVLGFATLKTLYIIDEPLFFPRAHIACINGVVWTAASISVLSSIAVSYTHLDVYKRQPTTCPWSNTYQITSA